MKKFIGVSIFALLCGTAVFGQSFVAEGLRFVAPTVNGTTGIVMNPEQGEIVYDTSGSGGFKGYNGSTWSSMDTTSTALPAGTIVAFGGTTAPTGYVLCDGSSYAAATYPGLAQALWDSSTSKYAFGGSGTYPAGSFNVPDFRGRFLRGADLGAGRDPNTTSTDRPVMNTGGNTGASVGSIQGQATKKNGLTASSSDSGHVHSMPYPSGGGGTMAIQPLAGNGSYIGSMAGMQPGYANITTTINTGDSETRPINANVNYIIKL